MTTLSSLQQLDLRYGARNYQPLPFWLVRGDGSWVWDANGKRYLDLLSAYSALNFGHRHPALVSAMIDQVGRLTLCSRAFQSEELSLFCRDLAEFCGFDAVLPMNSGTEAVESALKIARKWGLQKKGVGPQDGKIIVMNNNFHGRTITVVSFSTEPDYREGFGPYTPGFVTVPFGDLGALEGVVNKNTIAVLLEPVQAEAGILVPPPGYLSGVRKVCSQNNCLMILDEIQTGLARTGRNFCFEHEGAHPDILIIGKSLGGGLIPISAVTCRREVMDVLQPGQHGSTFGGNPLACAVARRSISLLGELNLSERASKIGERVQHFFSAVASDRVKEIRGRGALVGIELKAAAGGARRYCEQLADRGVLCKETHGHVIRIAPPLTVEMSDLDWGLEQISRVLSAR